MTKFFKYLFISIIIIFIFLFLFIFFLSQFGLETKRFNPIISEQVKKYNENLNLDIKKVKVYLSISNLNNPKLKISTKDPILILDKKKIFLNAVDTKIDILSYFKNNFVIEDFEIWTKDNKIKDLISIAALEKPKLVIYKIFLKDGYANAYSSIKFDKEGKITGYKIEGKVKKGKIKFNKKFNIEDINFNFSTTEKGIIIKKAKFNFNKINFLSNEIVIPKSAGKIILKGDVESKKTSIKLSELKNFFNNDLYFIEDKDITLKTKNNFSLTVQKGKINELKYSSQINLNEINIILKNNNLNNYFSDYNNSILLKDNLLKINYENKNFTIEGKSKYSLNKFSDKIMYKINSNKKGYDFFTIINFYQNSLKIKPIEYSKKNNKKSNLKLKGFYSENKLEFNEILYEEGNNFFEIIDLNLNDNFKISNLKKLKVNYLNDNRKKSEFVLLKSKNGYDLKGKSFDSYKLINNMLLSDSDKSFFDNFNLKNDLKFKINIDKVFLNDNYFSRDLSAKLNIKNNKVYSLNLISFFDDNKKFKLDIKTLKNKSKTTSFYSDNAEPFVEHYKFIKGFKGGKIDFYSVKKNNLSNSTLNIFDFKVREMPALTKLLSLASLQGIADIMTGEGIRFNDFEMNFKNKNKLMTIDEIYAIGPAISVLMRGYIERDKLISLRGTLVPATTLNKVIGSLPLIGKILVGKKTGEGVFGVSFKIKGPPKKLKTTVNPIKTLTPRFITRTLEKAKGN